MKRFIAIALSAVLSFSMVSCKKADAPAPAATPDAGASAGAETLTGTGEGFGGPLTVTVTREGGKITKVEVGDNKETNGIGTPAIEALPAKIVEANSADVDVIAGATVSSKAIIYAVNNALDPVKFPFPIAKEPVDDTPKSAVASDIYQGFGVDNSGRVGPGKDAEDVQVYSINQIFANVLFDGDGKILDLVIDQFEVATPNYDGEGMPHFSAFPTQGGYNMDSNHTGEIDTKSPDTEDGLKAEITTWRSKRERGDAYKMTTGTWQAQMDAFQNVFIGMTVAEIEDWFAKYCSDINGRPLKADSSNPEDVTKFNALAKEEQDMLADVTTGATMSLNDSHGNIIGAIKKAYEARVPLEITAASAMGIGVDYSVRVGPGKDEKNVQVYSINEVIANTVFDESGKIVAITVDQVEIATPNYDGEGMPHFSGFPGQMGYNYDEKHDGVISGVRTPTEETFKEDIAGWATKRERGESYKMTTGTWQAQMDGFQKVFVGKTAAEVEEWFNKYTSTINGRPLRADSTNEEDVTRFNELTAEEQSMLVDVISTSTMSLNDSHGNIINAIKKSFTSKKKIDVKVG